MNNQFIRRTGYTGIASARFHTNKEGEKAVKILSLVHDDNTESGFFNERKEIEEGIIEIFGQRPGKWERDAILIMQVGFVQAGDSHDVEFDIVEVETIPDILCGLAPSAAQMDQKIQNQIDRFGIQSLNIS